MTLLEGILAVIAIALVVGMIVLGRLVAQLTVRVGRASDDVGLAARRIAELAPSASALMEKGQTAVESLRSLASSTNHVVDDVRTISGSASAVTTGLRRGIESGTIDRYRALFSGVRAGFDVLRRYRGGNGSHETKSFVRNKLDNVEY